MVQRLSPSARAAAKPLGARTVVPKTEHSVAGRIHRDPAVRDHKVGQIGALGHRRPAHQNKTFMPSRPDSYSVALTNGQKTRNVSSRR